MTLSPEAPATDWSKTLHLPQTAFPMRANLPTREPGWVADWLKKDENGHDLYTRLLAKRRAEGAPTYIVHLGPPYANGNMHMGHALTYVLKDFVVRSKFMAGYASPYVPGWDCHGLPIEWKVEQDLIAEGKTKHSISKTELRERCRAYAQKWVDVQKQDWQRFGALGDWDRPYKTMEPANEAGIVRELGKLVQRGLVEKSLRSTLWSWAEETAMAEAEVEYDDNHKSTAIYVAMPLVNRPNEHLVIWTTTPWTIPANRAVAVHEKETYVRVRSLENNNLYWVATPRVSDFMKETGMTGTCNKDDSELLAGFQMLDWQYTHPLYPEKIQPVLHGFHVTTESGTGLVHIAPAHGAEDFTIGKEANLDLRCPVNGAGKYEDWVEANLPADSTLKGKLAGHLIWACKADILAELTRKGLLLKASDITHKYPVSWRSKKPLIFRTTEQWFVALDKPIEALGGKTLRQASLNRIYGQNGERGVQWVPEYGKNRIGSMIENRPDWCISRQRAWGVPITIFMEKATGAIVTDPAVWEHIAALVAQENINAWDGRIAAGRTAELFPAGWLEAHGKTADDFTPVQDILDVWFDSGTTHAHVVRADSAEGQRFHRTDGKRPADLYQEGSDQHRGWFHSSLLTSVANYGDAPYESVVTSGFVVDGEGRKFSKSLGNGVEPKDLLSKYGMDIIRLWIASSDYSEDIRYSPQIVESAADTYRRLRNTLRWLLGNLNGFADSQCTLENMPELEQYILARLGAVLEEARTHFDAFQFHKATRAILEFCGTELSNFYFDARKDVLYCDAATSPTRIACQSVLVQVFKGLVTHLNPLMPFTCNEAWMERYGPTAHVQLETFAIPPRTTVDAARWSTLLALRDTVNAELEKLRAAGNLGANAEAHITVPTELPTELVREVCGVSEAHPGSTLAVSKHTGHKCPRCWRYYGQLEESGVCLRCEDATQPQQKAA